MTTPLTQIGDRGQRRERFSKPALTLLMGADGAGKTSWRRRRREQLPDWFLDPEWVADGVGDWNTDDARRRADELIADQIDKAIARRDDFGIETTYTDEPSRALVERAKTAGYRIRGYFIGTETPAINIERIHGRTEADKEALRRHRLGPRDGPWVDPQRGARAAPAGARRADGDGRQLRRAGRLRQLGEATGQPEPTTALILENGQVSYEADRPARWVAAWRAQFPR